MWKYTSYLQIGLSHKVAGIGCQDRVLVRENEHCVVAALSDGLGSLTNSHIASAAATQGIWEIFSAVGEEPLALTSPEQKQQFAASIVEKLTSCIHAAATAHEVAVSTMDCTLAFVYVSKLHHYAVAGRLGDSAVCVIGEENSVAINDGGHSANGTSALLDRDAAAQLEISVWNIPAQNIYGFVLCSDGLDGEIYMKGSPQVKKAAEVYFNSVQNAADPQSAIRERIALLTAHKDSSFDDDISVAVISCAKSRIALPNDPTWLCTCGERNRLQDTYCVACGQDFIALYRNVRFREHGGKSAFFAKINQDPEAEKRLIGFTAKIPAEPAKKQTPPRNEQNAPVKPSAPAAAAHNSAQKVPQTNRPVQAASKQQSPKKPNKAMWWIKSLIISGVLCFFALILGCIIGSSVQKIFSREVRQLKNTVAQQKQQIQALEQSLDDKKPPEDVLNGLDISLEHGYYYIGTFREGQKIGKFIVCSEDDFDHALMITFDDHGVLTDPDSQWNPSEVESDSLDMRTGPGAESELICCLHEDDIVYILQTEPVEIDGQKWVEIICNNTVGWVDISGLHEHD